MNGREIVIWFVGNVRRRGGVSSAACPIDPSGWPGSRDDSNIPAGVCRPPRSSCCCQPTNQPTKRPETALVTNAIASKCCSNLVWGARRTNCGPRGTALRSGTAGARGGRLHAAIGANAQPTRRSIATTTTRGVRRPAAQFSYFFTPTE